MEVKGTGVVLGRDSAMVQVAKAWQVGQHKGRVVLAADWVVGQTKTRQTLEVTKCPHLSFSSNGNIRIVVVAVI